MKQQTEINYELVTCEIAGAQIKLTFEGEFFTVGTLVGTAKIQLTENGKAIPLFANMTVRTRPGERFQNLWISGSAGALIGLYFGFGNVVIGGTAGGGGGSAQIVVGADADPNAGLVAPDDPTQAAIYYEDSDPSVFWAWSVTNRNWIALIQ